MCIWLNIEVFFVICFLCLKTIILFPKSFIPLTRCKCRIIPQTVQIFLWKKSTEIHLLLLFNFSVIYKVSSMLLAYRRLNAPISLGSSGYVNSLFVAEWVNFWIILSVWRNNGSNLWRVCRSPRRGASFGMLGCNDGWSGTGDDGDSFSDPCDSLAEVRIFRPVEYLFVQIADFIEDFPSEHLASPDGVFHGKGRFHRQFLVVELLLVFLVDPFSEPFG